MENEYGQRSNADLYVMYKVEIHKDHLNLKRKIMDSYELVTKIHKTNGILDEPVSDDTGSVMITSRIPSPKEEGENWERLKEAALDYYISKTEKMIIDLAKTEYIRNKLFVTLGKRNMDLKPYEIHIYKAL